MKRLMNDDWASNQCHIDRCALFDRHTDRHREGARECRESRIYYPSLAYRFSFTFDPPDAAAAAGGWTVRPILLLLLLNQIVPCEWALDWMDGRIGGIPL